MRALFKNPMGKILTLVMVGLGYSLWTFSDTVEDLLGMPALLPLVRLGVIVTGLSAAEMIYQSMSRWISSRHTPDTSKGI